MCAQNRRAAGVLNPGRIRLMSHGIRPGEMMQTITISFDADCYRNAHSKRQSIVPFAWESTIP